jgi:5-methylcytosine-specific restriction protein B
MARIPGIQYEPVYRAAASFVERALRSAGSLFTPRLPVWTPDVLADLHERRARADDGAGGKFAERWARRLDGAPPTTVRLAAELAYVHVMFAADLTPVSKRRLVTQTLARSPNPPDLSGELDAALDQGLAGTGLAFKLRRMSQLDLLITVAVQWWQQPEPNRSARLTDPWAFKSWLGTLPHDSAYAQREALLHLVHPDTFEPIVSPVIKQRIVAALSHHVPAGVDDVDAALAGIRAALERRHGHGFQFIALDIPGLWEPAKRRAIQTVH